MYTNISLLNTLEVIHDYRYSVIFTWIFVVYTMIISADTYISVTSWIPPVHTAYMNICDIYMNIGWIYINISRIYMYIGDICMNIGGLFMDTTSIYNIHAYRLYIQYTWISMEYTCGRIYMDVDGIIYEYRRYMNEYRKNIYGHRLYIHVHCQGIVYLHTTHSTPRNIVSLFATLKLKLFCN